MPKKKRMHRQKRARNTNRPLSAEEAADRFLNNVLLAALTGSFPCPLCGSRVEFVGHDHRLKADTYHCTNPHCAYGCLFGSF